ncbi:hypothetical protein ASF60_08830 [Methylobacterium sp. Leaf113]|nr:hypothetical protein ASF60_08830 [Methylobacterium sp. Leaf113]
MCKFSGVRRALVIGLAAGLLTACLPPPSQVSRVAVVWPDGGGTSVTLQMERASGRWLVPVAFRRPDGSERRLLAWLNMGAAAPILSKDLYRALGLAEGHDLLIDIGGVSVTVEAGSVKDGPGSVDGQDLFGLLFAPRTVEAVLPAGVLQHFAVTIDPKTASLTLAPSGASRSRGVPVPVRTNPTTGITVVDAQVGDQRIPLVLDVGAPYTWLRGRTVAGWLLQHPEWRRADGAVGRANLAMADLALERAGTIIRLPGIDVGGLMFRDVGALGTGPLGGAIGDAALGEIFWDTWQVDAGEPVTGWLGNNVLDTVRLTLDYAAGTSFWERLGSDDPGDLDGVGLTLVRRDAGYAIAAVATRDGYPLVSGVEVGDRLLQVDGYPLDGLAPDAVRAKLSARPGERRRLQLDRAGTSVTVATEGTRF